MTLDWYLADLKTGRVVTELPLSTTQPIERTINAERTYAATIAVADPQCPPNWSDLLDPRRSLLVPVDDGVPLCGYTIEYAEPGDPTVPLTLASLEGIPEHSFCRDHDFDGDEADTMVGLLSDVIVPSFGFELEVTATGRQSDHSYAWSEDRTVASALDELTTQAGGPEWVTRVRWTDDTHRQFTKVIEIGPQVGRTMPSVVIENQHLSARKRPRDFKGLATHFVATGDGAGENRPMSEPVVDAQALAQGIPQWEARASYPTLDDDGLQRAAERGLLRRRNGTQTWETPISATEVGAPKVGRHFDAGDTITARFGPWGNVPVVADGRVIEHRPVDPATLEGFVRVIGWRADIEGRLIKTVTPSFWEPPEEGQA